ncbi:hypothetical protein Cfor_12597 [Coptotermes formosanus]|uniref:Uncharacterized protein n=1 Tax=Coptotermes formosanus TaxID=36987 RepID=A0A6L2Q7X2_COPFO|nr:hypothetical protein Cfor_12597 [Coptotermes formosanus]
MGLFGFMAASHCWEQSSSIYTFLRLRGEHCKRLRTTFQAEQTRSKTKELKHSLGINQRSWKLRRDQCFLKCP